MVRVKCVSKDVEQAKFGKGSVPCKLEIGKIYEVVNTDMHSWHKLYQLAGIRGQFNSVLFKEVIDGILKTYHFHIEQSRDDGEIIYIGWQDKRKKSLYIPEKDFEKFLEGLFSEENILKYSK